MAVDRLKGVVKFLQQCRGAEDFESIQKKQYDVLLQELEQVRQMNHDEAAEALSLLKDIDFTADMRSCLGEDSPREGWLRPEWQGGLAAVEIFSRVPEGQSVAQTYEPWIAITSSDCSVEVTRRAPLQTWFKSSKRGDLCNAHYSFTSHRPRALQ